MDSKKIKQNLLAVLLLVVVSISAQADNWYPVVSGTQKKLNTIYFSSSNVGYIGGNDSLLMKTTDGGRTWNKLNFSGVTFFSGSAHILNLQFLNDSVGFMSIGPNSGSYTTINGGLNWTPLPILSNQCYNQGLFFFDPNNGFIGGSGCFQGELISRLSAGVWSPANLNSTAFNPANYITDIDFYNSSFGLASSRSGYIYRTVDGGINWDSVPSPDIFNQITSVLIVNDTLAYAGYDAPNNLGFGLYISTDGGLSWNQDLNSATFFYPDFMTLHQTGNSKIYTGGSTQGTLGVIFYNPGQFNSWGFDPVDHVINDISSYNDSLVFAVGDSGYIVVNKLPATIGIHDFNFELQDFSVFPNPAKNVIHFTCPTHFNTTKATLKISSAIGKLISDIAFTPTFDVSGLAKGIYFIELKADELILRKKVMVE